MDGQYWSEQEKVYLGLFENKEDARKTYDEAAIKYFGEFARINKDEQKINSFHQ